MAQQDPIAEARRKLLRARERLARQGASADAIAAIDEALALLGDEAGDGGEPDPLALLHRCSTAILELPFGDAAALVHLAELAVPGFADCSGVIGLRDDGAIELDAVAHRDPERLARMRAISGLRAMGRLEQAPTITAALRHKRAVLIADIEAERRAGEAGTPVAKAALAADLRSVVVAPLSAHGRSLGAIAFGRGPERPRFREADLPLAEQLAHVVALAVDNVRLQVEAERALRARGDLLSFVSHDLKNPLGAILMNATFLEKQAGGADPVATRTLAVARNVIRATERMQRLLRDLQDAASVESGRFAVEPEPHEAGALVAEAVELMRPTAAAKQLRLEGQAGGGRIRVACDRERVLQVLSNLIGNAIKFTDEGGRIAVQSAPAGGPHGGMVRFTVADTGRGISAEHLPHVFDRYWQAQRSDRRGVGLGLYIVRGIVEAHGGRIDVESRVGEGTTFAFTLPLADATVADGRSAASTGSIPV